MKAYWMVRCNVKDAQVYGEYIQLAGPAIEKHGGRYLVRGGEQLEVEGEGYERTVLVEFNSFEQAKACYQSEEYQAAYKVQKEAADRLVVIVEGAS
tara:strand:+ start:5273 stop:5560 length:288 start_codon:yes stop_codon:yes gene_type:complete